MCDEFTALADEENLARRGLNRREFAAIGMSAALAGCATGSVAGGADGGELSERMVSITTPDGVCDAFFVHPAKGAHPGVIMWPDVAGLRDVKKIMARAIAAQGYAVLAVNQYYRTSPSPVFASFADFMKFDRTKLQTLTGQVTPAAVTSDAKAFVAFLDAQDAVDKTRKIGSNGYCMGGPMTVRTAAAVPSRVGAAASLHGGGLVTPEPDSPHRLMARTSAGFLFAIARNDDQRAPTDKDELRKAADAAGRPADIRLFAADHGWCVADSPAYDPNEADRAFQRMMVLYATL